MTNIKNLSASAELSSIARRLMLYSSFISNCGLLNGKMGVVLFFYHYSIYTRCSRYRRFADELIEEIYHEVSKHTPKDFANGLCGIVWGLTYLVKCGFVDMDDDIFEELDAKIMEWDISNISDYSIETGLSGVGLYLICRLYGSKGQVNIPVAYRDKVIRRLAESSAPECQMVYTCFKNNQQSFPVQQKQMLCSMLPLFKSSKQAKMIGIKEGLAGVGLRMLLCN